MTASEIASEDDRLWFDEHPDRYIRFRHATQGDRHLRASGTNWFLPGPMVAVFCPTTGIRYRFVVYILPGSPILRFANGEAHEDADVVDALVVGIEDRGLSEREQGKLLDALDRCQAEGGRLTNWSAK